MQKPMRFERLSGLRPVSGGVTAFTRAAYATVAFVCLVVLTGAPPAPAQAESPQLHPNLARQIKAVFEEKRSRTAAEKKIDSRLLMAIKHYRGEPTPYPVRRGLDVAADGTILVDIKCPVTDNMANDIEAMGGELLKSHPRYDMIRARVPVDNIEHLAAKSIVQSVGEPSAWVTRQGSVVTEGDRAHGADQARSVKGLDGSGVKICAISDGVDDLENQQNMGELPAVQIPNGQRGEGSEGTALLNIIHDMAPGAELGFATALDSPQQFADNIRALERMSCDVIVDDVGYANQSPFQPDIITQAVDEVVDKGTVYFSAAGNSGSLSKGTSGTYEADYFQRDTRFEDLFPPTGPNPITGGVHDFDLGDNGIDFTNGVVDPAIGMVLNWSDPLGGSDNDYDLCITDMDLENLLACSANIQDGNGDPIEGIFPVLPGDQAIIINFSTSAEERFLHLGLFGSGGQLETGTNGAIFGHPGSDKAIAVGAVDVSQTDGGEFDGTEDVEDFSSDGPRRVFFDADGNPFTPGNFSSTGGVVRDKPDISAADGTTTTTPGFETFFGTSAAAPHAAAVAGLLLEADPTLTPGDVADLMKSTATDIEDSGFDDISGFGLVDAFDAVDGLNGDGEELINDSLSLDDLDTAFDPGDTRAPAGVFTIDATFNNISADSFFDVFFEVAELTGGNQVLNADGGPGGVGSQFSVPVNIDSGDTFTQTFEVGLQQASPFRFFVDAFGTPR